MTLAVDVMSGDQGAPETIAGVRIALEAHDDLRVILVGQDNVIKPFLDNFPKSLTHRAAIHQATEVVTMDESPVKALRGKKNSSMRLAIELVAKHEAQACVSAGNTGALMALAKVILKTLPGIDRPAISAVIPTSLPDRAVRILDLGANVDCSPEHLYQFAIMGSVLSQVEQGLASPLVGLLNIGSELIKGNELVKKTAELLQTTQAIHYHGYIEPDHINDGVVDVVVCDGFTGNVYLKGIEGIASMISSIIKNEFNRNWLTKIVALQALPILSRVRSKVDPARYNGASFAGLNGIVVKSHGAARASAFANAILTAYKGAQQNLTQQMSIKLQQLLGGSA